MSRTEAPRGSFPDVGDLRQEVGLEIKGRRLSVQELRLHRSKEAAIHFMTPLLDTVGSQVKDLETHANDPLLYPTAALARWGAFNGLAISDPEGVDSLYSYFPHIPRISRGREMSEYTGQEITYGGLLADKIKYLLTEDLREGENHPSREAIWRRTKSIITTLRSWSRIPLLPSVMVKQFLWYVPDPDRDIMENLPIICRETQASLKLLADGEPQALRYALTQIAEELDKAYRFIECLKNERYGITRFTLPRPYEPLLLPFRVIAEESLVENGNNPASHQTVATEIAEAYLLGRHGFNPRYIKSVLRYFAGKPPERVPLEMEGFSFHEQVCFPIVPWLALEFQRLGLCELEEEDYRAFGLPLDVWRYHLHELKEQQLLNTEVFNPSSSNHLAEVHKQHRIAIEALPKPPHITEETLVYAAPGKYYPWAHLRHRAMIRAGLEVAQGISNGNAVVMGAPNRRDPNYLEMESECPAKRRGQRLKKTLTGLLGPNLFVTHRGQEDDIHSNADKFRLGFPRYLKRRFEVPVELGFLGGFEKASLYRGKKAILAPRLEDLINIPRALAMMKEEFENYGKGELTVVLLSCMDYAGERIRELIRLGDEESLIQLSTMLHRPLLLELERRCRSTGRTAEAKIFRQLLT
jgi:hypothetical protein